MNQQQPLHVVFGHGQIGSLLARGLASRGLRVRVVSRRPLRLVDGIEHRVADATDTSAVDAAAEGAAVLYHCIGVPYPEWQQVLPRVGENLRRAALRQGARLVFLDNLYMLGRTEVPMTEDLPFAPRVAKGELRARLEQELLDAREQEGLDLAIGRASDFFGPGVTNSAVFYPPNLRQIARGGTVRVPGDPDQMHSYSYAPDVAEGLLRLGMAEKLPGPIWHLPVAFQDTTRRLVEDLGRHLGTRPRVKRMPNWMWAVGSLFSPVVREAREMVYQWEGPFVLHDHAFRFTFGMEPTPRDEALAASASWIRQTFR